LFNLYIYIMIW